MGSGGGGKTDYAAQESASKAEANKLKYEKDLENWRQNQKAQTDKRSQASKDSFDRRAQRSLLSKAGEWGLGVAKSFIGEEKSPELKVEPPKTLLGGLFGNGFNPAATGAKKADGTVVEEDPLQKKSVIKQ